MKKMVNRIEIAFWDTVTPLMSDSALLRGCIRGGYAFTHAGSQTRSRRAAAVLLATCSAIGLFAGFLLGRAGVALW